MVKYSELKVGDRLKADGGFDCLADGEVVTVLADDKGKLFVACDSGTHYLDGQLDFDDNDTLVGLERVDE